MLHAIATKLHNLSKTLRLEVSGLIALVVLLGLIVFALIWDINHPTTPVAKAQQKALITITATGFEPQYLTVAPDTVVTWQNLDSSVHQVASDPFPEATEHPDLNSKAAINTHGSYTYKVTKPGLYDYNDPLYPERGGKIEVR